MPRVSVVCRWWWMAPSDTGDVNCESHSSISRISLGSWHSVCSVGGDHWLYPLQCNSVGRWSLALCSATVLGGDHWLYPLQYNSVGRWPLALCSAIVLEVTISFTLCSATVLGGDHWLYPLQCNSVGRWPLALPFAVKQCWKVTVGFTLCSETMLGGDRWLYPLQWNNVGRWPLALPFAVQQCWKARESLVNNRQWQEHSFSVSCYIKQQAMTGTVVICELLYQTTGNDRNSRYLWAVISNNRQW